MLPQAPGLGALLISPIVGGLADAYGRRWMALVAPLGLALTRLNLAARPSVKAFVASGSSWARSVS